MGNFNARLFSALLFLLVPAMGQTAGSTAMDAFNFVTGARAAGMGGTATAAVADPTALQWNPSALSLVSQPSFVLSHLAWVAGISYSYAGFSLPTRVGTAGISLQMLNYGVIESTKGLASGVDASDFGLTAGGAIPTILGFRAGGAVKYFRHALAGAFVGEGAVDLGASYDLVPGLLTTGMVIQNLGISGKLEGRAPPLPSSVRFGMAYSSRVTQEPIPVVGRDQPWSPSVDILVAGDVTALQKGEPVHYSLGLEAVISEILGLRTGYQQSLDKAGTGAGFCGGGGVKLYGLRLDYAYGSVGDLGSGQYVTLTWLPDRKKTMPAQAGTASPASSTVVQDSSTIQPAREEAGKEYLAATGAYSASEYDSAVIHAEAATRIDPSHWQAWQVLGHARYARGDKKGALEAYHRAISINPDNPQLKAWVDQIEVSAQ